jgi:hypothetical protein
VVGALRCYQAIWGESFENILLGTPSFVSLEVGHGTQTRFGHDVWSEDRFLKETFLELFLHCKGQGIFRG